MDCIFCKIISGEIPAKIILQDDYSMGFMDAFAVTLGHCLVIPKTHYSKVQDMSLHHNTKLFEMVQKMTSIIDDITGSTLISIHNGIYSGQEIPHVHVHLIPRSENDGAGPVHSMFKSNTRPTVPQTDTLYKKLLDSARK